MRNTVVILKWVGLLIHWPPILSDIIADIFSNVIPAEMATKGDFRTKMKTLLSPKSLFVIICTDEITIKHVVITNDITLPVFSIAGK